jgi:hypothetical protein
MGQYTTKGLYNGYDKKHKERDKTDYYATPTVEVKNILETLGINFDGLTILEPCAGGGHMLKGIKEYAPNATVYATDFSKHPRIEDFEILTGEEYDFLADNYNLPDENIDWIIMNPPYSTIEPFTIRALEIANNGVIMLARLQFLEGSGRYEKILKDNPPTDVYVYVDRVQCWKNGDKPEGSSAQAYAWFVWNKVQFEKETKIHWIRRA